ncbi:MAG TPA: tripartite tricarboxylate transporter substrate-binding protein, partial [Xanthobacteraceae bacterium]|nr:tripartite tricarboxylate transporter substrate-binding protein [Xanthobacteraceae bacterium]
MPIRCIRGLGTTLTVGAALLAPSGAARADGFYQGKSLEIIVASGVGDSYDALSRLVGRHIGRYLPGNPTVVVQNMPGAGGILAANQLYNLAAHDGTVIGMLDQSVYETQLFKVPGLKADVTKMNWIGRVISNNAALIAWHTAAVQKIADAYSKELVVSSSGSSSQLRWTILKQLLGVKFKLITGYKSSADGLLAMERG